MECGKFRNCFAAAAGDVFLSTNNGTDWKPVNTGLTNTYIGAFAVFGNNIFAGGDVACFFQLMTAKVPIMSVQD